MKKFLAVLFMATLTVWSVSAKDVITMDMNKLPLVARNFINQHFTRPQISYIKIDSEFLSKKYEVVLSNRTKIEFNGNGEWEEVDGNRNDLPLTIIPEHIKTYVNAQYPGTTYRKIERDRGEVEIKLSNHLSLTFDKKGQLIDIDD